MRRHALECAIRHVEDPLIAGEIGVVTLHARGSQPEHDFGKGDALLV